MAARATTARWSTALAVALAVHALFVAYAVLTLKLASPLSEPHAVWLDLTRLSPPPKPPKPKLGRPQHEAAAAVLRPAVTAPANVPDAIPVPPAQPAAPQEPGAGLGQMLRRGLGCASPDAYGLTPEERAHCDEKLAQEGHTAPRLGLNIAPDKQAAYARYARCRSDFVKSGMPPYGSKSEHSSIAGLGDTSFTSCPMESRLP